MIPRKDPNPFLFACGVPRSGTTLLQRMLNSHPELAVSNDSHFIPRALELTDKSLVTKAICGEPIPLTTELLGQVGQYHRFRRLGITPEELESTCCLVETYQQLVSDLYALYAQKAGKRVAGEKTPDYVRRLSLLNGLFPDAKLIHLVRDGRDVALSLMQWATPEKGPGRIALWNNHPVAVCALWWRWLVLSGREQATTLDGTIAVEVCYEELVREPAATMEKLCVFLDLEYSPNMLAFNQGKSRKQDNLSAKSAWLGPQTGLRNWRTDMDEEQVELFEVLASDALEMFGYEVCSTDYSNRTVAIAKFCERWWDEHFLPARRTNEGGSTQLERTTCQSE